MTELELVEHIQGTTPTVVAVSTSYSALVSYCKKQYKTDVVKDGGGDETYYTIRETNIAIVAFDYE
jgi:hypothetical protein